MNEQNIEVLQAQRQQMAALSSAVQAQFGDGLPYDRERLIAETRFFMASAAEAMLEAGKRLIVLKEQEGHGEFIRICEEQLGIGTRSAQLMMSAAAKFLSPKLAGKAGVLTQLGKTKLYDLMLEDDEALTALTEGGTLAGLQLDDIERMSSRELRKALREARADKEALAKVLTDKNAKLDEMAHALAKKPLVVVLPPDEKSKELRAEVSALAFEAEADITGKLREGLRKMREHEEETGLDHRAWQAGLVRHLENLLAGLRSEFDIPDDAEMGGQIPDWMTAQQADIDALVQDNLPAQEH
jgi:hypothetical protein